MSYSQAYPITPKQYIPILTELYKLYNDDKFWEVFADYFGLNYFPYFRYYGSKYGNEILMEPKFDLSKLGSYIRNDVNLSIKLFNEYISTLGWTTFESPSRFKDFMRVFDGNNYLSFTNWIKFLFDFFNLEISIVNSNNAKYTTAQQYHPYYKMVNTYKKEGLKNSYRWYLGLENIYPTIFTNDIFKNKQVQNYILNILYANDNFKNRFVQEIKNNQIDQARFELEQKQYIDSKIIDAKSQMDNFIADEKNQLENEINNNNRNLDVLKFQAINILNK